MGRPHPSGQGVEYGTQVTSSDSGSGRDPLDPVYARLFRPDDPPERADYDEEPLFEAIVDPVIDPRDEPAPAGDESPLDDGLPEEDPAPRPEPEPLEQPAAEPAAGVVVPADPVADTGRLFRSQGATEHPEAVLALASDHFGRLRTLDRRQDGEPPPVLADAGPLPVDAADDADAEEVVMSGSTRRRRRGSADDDPRHRTRGITGGAVYLIVIGVTVLVSFANALLSDGDLGWPTGLALLASSVYAALTVRREDDYVAIIVPPVAFLVAALTAGQLFLGSAEGSLLNRAVVVFFALADNWYWIIGTTIAALAIVLVRRART